MTKSILLPDRVGGKAYTDPSCSMIISILHLAIKGRTAYGISPNFETYYYWSTSVRSLERSYGGYFEPKKPKRALSLAKQVLMHFKASYELA